MSAVDRSRLPVPGADRPFHFPRIAKRMLPNGLELRAVTHRAVPVAAVVLLVPGGSSVDPADAHGLVSITAGLLDEGSRGQSALDIADRVARIGGELDLDVGVDAVVVGMTTLDRFLDTGLSLVHEVVTEPNLANDDFNRIRNLRLERLRQIEGPRRRDGRSRALRACSMARIPYGHLSLGSEPSLNAMTVDDSRALHAAMFTPAGVDAGRSSAIAPKKSCSISAAAVFESWRAHQLADDRSIAPPRWRRRPRRRK